MNQGFPEGARPVARVLPVGPGRKLLLLRAEHPADGHRFWLTPGGGLESQESFEDAARRESREETGLTDVQVGPWVWTRRHPYSWNGRWCDRCDFS
jgi:8-oxo-dGTP pyrophosphatase MutT (NUDIX family)